MRNYLKVHFTLGLERAVIVTGSGNGTNNQITLDALSRMNGRFKGLALLDPAIGDAELLGAARNSKGNDEIRTSHETRTLRPHAETR